MAVRVISSVFTAVLVTAISYLTISLPPDRYDMKLAKNHGLVVDARVLVPMGVAMLSVFAVSLYRFSTGLMRDYVLGAIALCGLSIAAIYDLIAKKIPNRVVAALLILWVVIEAVFFFIIGREGSLQHIFTSIMGGAAGGLIFLICYLLSRKKLGAGDVKLMAVMGLYVTGERIIGMILYGCLACAVYSIVQMLRKKLTARDGVALAPFLYIGSVVAYLIA